MEKVDPYSWMVGIRNSKDERIIQKLKAIIADTPYPGERETALNVLKRYCLAHNISEEDLDNSIQEQIFSYDVPRGKNQEWAGLLRCISYHYFERKGKAHEAESRFKQYTYRDQGLRNLINIEIKCYPAEFIEIIAEYEVYAAAFKKQVKAFLKKKHAVVLLDVLHNMWYQHQKNKVCRNYRQMIILLKSPISVFQTCYCRLTM